MPTTEMSTSEMPSTELNELTKTETVNEVDIVPDKDSEFCENCHLLLNGPYCSHCGQAANSQLKYFWMVIMHLLDDIFSFDSRASRTLWPLITRPGFLSNEYFAGRRVHYVPPLRLYLFISIIFFITLKFFVATNDNNIIKVSDKQSFINQVTSHLDKLKEQKVTLEKDNAAGVDVIDKIAKLDTDIAKFTVYYNDLKSDFSEDNNERLITITRELVELEFELVKDELPEDKKARFDALVSSKIKAYNGEADKDKKKEFTIGNDGQDNVAFDFLSDDKNKKLTAFTKELTKKAEKAFTSDTGPLIEQVISKLPQLMFILLPLFAVLLKVMYIFSNRLYMEHLTVALNSHSFIFITILLSEILDVLHKHFTVGSPDLASFMSVAAGGVLLWIPIYLFLMQKKVYKQGIFFTLIKFGIIGILYSIMIAITGIIAIVWGIMGT